MLVGNLMVVLFAGYETTACALSFTLFNLAKHPEIQDKLRFQLQASLNTEGSLEQLLEQLPELNCEYLDRIITETLRMYPPVIDYVIREMGANLEEVTLKSGLKVPKHVAVQLPVWTMHHDASVWPDPYRFDPDRENLPIGSKKNYAFAAFGIGQRNCIGSNLAMTEIRHLLVALVLHYRIELISDPRSLYAHRYRYDQNRLLEVECIAELIKAKDDIFLQLVPIAGGGAH